VSNRIPVGIVHDRERPSYDARCSITADNDGVYGIRYGVYVLLVRHNEGGNGLMDYHPLPSNQAHQLLLDNVQYDVDGLVQALLYARFGSGVQIHATHLIPLVKAGHVVMLASEANPFITLVLSPELLSEAVLFFAGYFRSKGFMPRRERK